MHMQHHDTLPDSSPLQDKGAFERNEPGRAEGLLPFILDVLHFFSLEETDCYGDLYWRTDGEYAPVTFWILVNSAFSWATADTEQIMPEDMGALRQAAADVRAVMGREWYAPDALLLWAARKRGMRPQPPAYPQDARLRALFDACGPERRPEEEGE